MQYIEGLLITNATNLCKSRLVSGDAKGKAVDFLKKVYFLELLILNTMVLRGNPAFRQIWVIWSNLDENLGLSGFM